MDVASLPVCRLIRILRSLVIRILRSLVIRIERSLVMRIEWSLNTMTAIAPSHAFSRDMPAGALLAIVVVPMVIMVPA